jgi:secretion/DNA translocation related CpaE-like protein
MPKVLISISDPKLKSEVTGLVNAAAISQTQELKEADLAIVELGTALANRANTPFILISDQPPQLENFKFAMQQGATDLLELPKESAILLQRLSDLENKKSVRAKTIAVISGSGGAGASTVAAMAAWGMRRRFQTVLVDLAPDGGGIDVIFGQERNPASRWRDFVNSQGEIPSKTFQRELPQVESLALMSHDRGEIEDSAVINKKVLFSLFQSFELAVVDLEIENLKNINFQEVVLVCTNTVKGVAAAVRKNNQIKKFGFTAKLVVRELSGGDVTPEKISQALKLELVAVISTETQFQKDLDRGNFINSRSKSFKTVSVAFEKLVAA